MSLRLQKSNRKAISPVLATVILIAITLIAAIAIAGFVFGLFGSFTNSPQLTANNVACYATGGHAECKVTLTNSGSGNAGIPSGTCSVNVGGAAVAGTLRTATGGGGALVTLVAGNSAPAIDFCYSTAVSGVGQSGSTAVGNIQTSSATVPFAGTWS